MFGNAKMNREDYEFTASYIKAFGKNNGNIEAKEAVVFLVPNLSTSTEVRVNMLPILKRLKKCM